MTKLLVFLVMTCALCLLTVAIGRILASHYPKKAVGISGGTEPNWCETKDGTVTWKMSGIARGDYVIYVGRVSGMYWAAWSDSPEKYGVGQTEKEAVTNLMEIQRAVKP